MTQLLYLSNPNLASHPAKILAYKDTEKGKALILDQTIFYVQGGGQPGDKGVIKSGLFEFVVENTIKSPDGEIWHLGQCVKGGDSILKDSQVEQILDVENRKLNSKIHSAGHLLDLAVKNIGLDWKGGKGYHFPDGPYVEYEILKPEEYDISSLIEQIQTEYDRLASQNLKVEIKVDDTKEFHGQALRTISFEGQSVVPCGGTHVDSTAQLTNFQIKKIKIKQNIARVSYVFNFLG